MTEGIQADTSGTERPFVVEHVVYRVTVESPEHATYEFTSWTHHNPYSAAMSFYRDLSSECARVEEQFLRKTEPRTVVSRGYGGNDMDATKESN